MMQTFVLIGCAAMLIATCAQAQDATQGTQGCLDGVCIATDVRAVPQTIHWKPVQPRFTSNRDPADIAEHRKRTTANAQKTYPNADAAIAELVDVSGFERSTFDAKVLPALTKLTVACRQMLWIGRYGGARNLERACTSKLNRPDRNDVASFIVRLLRRIQLQHDPALADPRIPACTRDDLKISGAEHSDQSLDLRFIARAAPGIDCGVC
jgi:hypothetical protein